MFGWLTRRKKPPVNGGSTMASHVRETFPDAVAFAAEQWMGYENHVRVVAPQLFETHGIDKVAAGFLAGPIFADLESRFPSVSAEAAAMVDRGAPADCLQVLLALIAAEGMISTGIDRQVVEGII